LIREYWKPTLSLIAVKIRARDLSLNIPDMLT